MDTFQISFPSVENDIETEIISSDDKWMQVQVDNHNLSHLEESSDFTATIVASAIEELVISEAPKHVSLCQASPLKEKGVSDSLSSESISDKNRLLSSSKVSKVAHSVKTNSASTPAPRTILPAAQHFNNSGSCGSPGFPIPFQLPVSSTLCPTLSLTDLLKCLQHPASDSFSTNSPSNPHARVVQSCSSVSESFTPPMPVKHRYVLPAGLQFSPVPPKRGQSFISTNITFPTEAFRKLPIPLNPAQTTFSYPIQMNPADSQQLVGNSLAELKTSSKAGAQANAGDETLTLVPKRIVEPEPIRKPCRCPKSMCLKLYCDCFNFGELCRDTCTCKDCHNNTAHEAERSKVISLILWKNPNAFKPKIGRRNGKGKTERSHIVGCHCRRSGCLKKYCECFLARTACGELCRCVGCKNLSENSDQLAIFQVNANGKIKTQPKPCPEPTACVKLNAVLNGLSASKAPDDQRYNPLSLVTDELVQKTADIISLKVQRVHSDATLSPKQAEMQIVDEFAGCLRQILDAARPPKINPALARMDQSKKRPPKVTCRTGKKSKRKKI